MVRSGLEVKLGSNTSDEKWYIFYHLMIINHSLESRASLKLFISEMNKSIVSIY